MGDTLQIILNVLRQAWGALILFIVSAAALAMLAKTLSTLGASSIGARLMVWESLATMAAVIILVLVAFVGIPPIVQCGRHIHPRGAWMRPDHRTGHICFRLDRGHCRGSDDAVGRPYDWRGCDRWNSRGIAGLNRGCRGPVWHAPGGCGYPADRNVFYGRLFAVPVAAIRQSVLGNANPLNFAFKEVGMFFAFAPNVLRSVHGQDLSRPVFSWPVEAGAVSLDRFWTRLRATRVTFGVYLWA